jgi:cupin 2 domain-containing protein
MTEPIPGRYRHYKGHDYTVVGVARHSETLEEVVLYRPEYGDKGLWVRPRAMFLETVTLDGRDVPRFQYMPSASGDAQPSTRSLFADLPGPLPQEVVTTLVEAVQVRIERIVSHGQASPPGFWYDQEQDEWVVVLKGAARLRFAEEEPPLEMKPGDFVNIPAHRKHRVEWTTPDEPTVWLAVHY